MLEDLDYYCVDNIPQGCCRDSSPTRCAPSEPHNRLTAVGVDARNRPEDLADVPRLVAELRRAASAANCCSCARERALISASARRARHPLSATASGYRKRSSRKSAAGAVAGAAD